MGNCVTFFDHGILREKIRFYFRQVTIKITQHSRIIKCTKKLITTQTMGIIFCIPKIGSPTTIANCTKNHIKCGLWTCSQDSREHNAIRFDGNNSPYTARRTDSVATQSTACGEFTGKGMVPPVFGLHSSLSWYITQSFTTTPCQPWSTYKKALSGLALHPPSKGGPTGRKYTNTANSAVRKMAAGRK
jgi:hypothetical protein